MPQKGLEHITRVTDALPDSDTRSIQPIDPPITWWGRYEGAARRTLTETATQVLATDCNYIVNNCIFGAGEISSLDNKWPPTRLRRGLVMGSVQSGKTASLIGVVAKSLDHGIDIVVVLAGTRLALWRQTYERISSQLDGWSTLSDSERRLARIFLPNPAVLVGTEQLPPLGTLYHETPNLVRRRLIERRPLIAIVMKHSDHLIRFGQFLHSVLETTYQRSNRPLHLLVIDDEADDGSVLDSTIEAGLAPDSEVLKQIPRHIARLWSGHRPHHETLHERLFATYVAYTATPQANFLQNDHNPLSPSDFVASLRVPSDEGATPPSSSRSTTYSEPLGLPYFYTGGEFFYRRLASPESTISCSYPFPRRNDFETNETFEEALERSRQSILSDSLRAYFVAGALRLYTAKRSLAAARADAPSTLEHIKQIVPPPHSMLFHPSARIDTHFVAARELVSWSTQFCPEDERPTEWEEAAPELNVTGLSLRLQHEEDLWKSWLKKFEATRARLSFLSSASLLPIEAVTLWPAIREILINQVFPHTRISIINSDPRADDRPHFDPEPVSGGLYAPPRDIFTIFVSGNVMARGLTLEGLTTTLFLRSSNDPLADTQMQMQRWFGYRGRYLHLCRAFMFEDQLQLFRAYHENDEALRREIVTEMNANMQSAPTPLVLQGRDFRATGKIANLRTLPLCPGSDPFIRILEHGKFADHNAGLVNTLLDKNEWEEINIGGILRGTLMRHQLGLVEAAELLESFRYTNHSPSRNAEHHDRWRAIASEVEIPSPDTPLFRPPECSHETRDLVPPSQCPYSIAAYLRLWSAMLTRRARGMVPTDNPSVPWSMINLSDYVRSAPRFYVGIRYGSVGLCSYSQLANHGVLSVRRNSQDGLLYATWGSRNPGEGVDAYLGDQLFDYHVHHEKPPVQFSGEPRWRPRGAPGLILFHLIQTPGQQNDAVAIALGIPLGGPDHFAALRSR